MNTKEEKRISKFLSLLLRHQPDIINLKLDDNGWANVDELIIKSALKRVKFTFEELEQVVANNDKQRFAFNDDKTKIRANQGHSLKTVDLQLQAEIPPHILYHGTVAKFMQAIKQNGLQKQSRQHVHLSADRTTATKVGSRRGVPVILSVRALDMHNKGFEFYKSENGVWLTDNVPTEFIEFKQ